MLEDRLHRQLTYDLLPSRPGIPGPWWVGRRARRRWCCNLTRRRAPCPASADSAQDLAAELVHYGFVHEVRCAGQGRPAWEGA